MNSRPTTRRTVLAAAVAAAAMATAPPASAAGLAGRPGRAAAEKSKISLHSWNTKRDWEAGKAEGTRVVGRGRPAVVFETPQGTAKYKDPHTGESATWEYATWTSPLQSAGVAAGEVIASWNAHTPKGTWLRVELEGRYSDGTKTPWYTMGIWTAGDGKDVPRRTSVDDQSDGKSSVWTDTLAIDDLDSDLRLIAYKLRVTLYRALASGAKPAVWRLSAMSSDVPDRFEVPASKPGPGRGIELEVPRFSQEVHKGRYPEYDNGGEAWCSPTSSTMILEYWGRTPSKKDLEWVDPDFTDPQVCHAARYTFDYQYEGCGNWPFNAAYAATYRDMEAVVTRLGSLTDVERLVAAGIPVITSQSFIESELDGAGYGTAGHLMTVIGFTQDGDIIANDPASEDNDAVRHIYKRRQWENIWLRTKRKDADGKVKSGTGGVCYLYFPTSLSAGQRKVLRDLGIR
ncbi:peptidase C39 family protein [Streptomyces bathyalis]|uniref:Peptidase C39 family protein n=1 Tax=Streptomyces bathyalis TaxID=2710756 RepID=A0A7T1TBN0_9ACTN|nr:peptidase C39 family protein [Streptomyces bathyalis]QPP09919.1 peptidase C39 family protein [Streptomyces bathyalis]